LREPIKWLLDHFRLLRLWDLKIDNPFDTFKFDKRREKNFKVNLLSLSIIETTKSVRNSSRQAISSYSLTMLIFKSYFFHQLMEVVKLRDKINSEKSWASIFESKREKNKSDHVDVTEVDDVIECVGK